MSRNLNKLVGALLCMTILIGVQLSTGTVAAQQKPSFVVLLDVSGSMDEPSETDPDRTRLDVARSALTRAFGNVAPESVNIGLRTFNAGTFSACGDRGSLVVPVGPADPALLIDELGRVEAGGGTPTPEALSQAAEDLKSQTGSKTIILVSDGESTCGDPCATAQGIVGRGIDVVINTVGFQTQGSPAEPELECVAQATGGSSIAVDDEEALVSIMTTLIATPTPQPPEPAQNTYVGLGDSYSSGFGVSPYDAGTNGESNDCQRSTRAYSRVVAKRLGMELDFHACQGGVTRDFLVPRPENWGEPAQLDHLDDTTSLLTFSIGGNDANFADTLRECIWGFELLPFNTCSNDDRVYEPVNQAIARLNNNAEAPKNVIPYDALFRDITGKAPAATIVAVGYPPLFTAEGSDRTFLPGGRCEGVKKADQRWMVEKTAELNSVLRRNAARWGVLFADATARFAGHALCGSDGEWFYSFLKAGRGHPTAQGQKAIAEEVLATLERSGGFDPDRWRIKPDETIEIPFVISEDSAEGGAGIRWPGSDVDLRLVSPSGVEFTIANPNGAVAGAAATSKDFLIVDPEPGTWTALLYGVDVPEEGEPVQFWSFALPAQNVRPDADISWSVDGTKLRIDGSGSTDSDGYIVGLDWYLTTTSRDYVYKGDTIVHKLEQGDGDISVTLVVTDDRGLTDFRTEVLTGLPAPGATTPTPAATPVDPTPFASPTASASPTPGPTPVDSATISPEPTRVLSPNPTVGIAVPSIVTCDAGQLPVDSNKDGQADGCQSTAEWDSAKNLDIAFTG